MKYLHFKPDGTLWVIAKRHTPELIAEFPNPLMVEDGYETMVEDPSLPVADGMPVGRREKTRSEIEAELTYATKRAAEYPPITDYIDGVVKGDQAQIDAYIAACQAVKAKYPKPI